MSRRAYQRKLRAQLSEWQNRIDQLRENLKQATGDTRREFEHRIEDLQAKQQAARRKLIQLDEAGQSLQHDAGERLKAVRGRIQRTVRRIVSRYH